MPSRTGLVQTVLSGSELAVDWDWWTTPLTGIPGALAVLIAAVACGRVAKSVADGVYPGRPRWVYVVLALVGVAAAVFTGLFAGIALRTLLGTTAKYVLLGLAVAVAYLLGWVYGNWLGWEVAGRGGKPTRVKRRRR